MCLLKTVCLFFLPLVFCQQKSEGDDSQTGKETSSGLSHAGKVGIAVGMGVLAGIVILLIVCCYALNQRKRKADDPEKPTQQSTINTIASSDNYGLPSHIHYVPYDALVPRTSSAGEYTEIDSSTMDQSTAYSQDVTDLYAKPNKVKTISKDKLIENSVYESDATRNAYDNNYLEITDDDTINRKPSVQRMVDNEIYNK